MTQQHRTISMVQEALRGGAEALPRRRWSVISSAQYARTLKLKAKFTSQAHDHQKYNIHIYNMFPLYNFFFKKNIDFL